MKKFSKYHFNITLITFVVLILPLLLGFQNINIGARFFSLISSHLWSYVRWLIIILLITSILLVLFSFYLFFKKDKNFKYILKKGISSLIIMFVVWSLSGLYQPSFGPGNMRDLHHDDLPGIEI